MVYSRNSLMNDFFNNGYVVNTTTMNTDIIEEESNYRLEMEVPGFAKEELSIALEKGYLTVEAKHTTQNEGKYIRQERVRKNLSRTFYIGDYLSEEDIQATYNNGILTITLPKYEAKRVETRKTISIG